MSFLDGAIHRLKRQKLANSANSTESGGPKRFVRRGDLQQQQLSAQENQHVSLSTSNQIEPPFPRSETSSHQPQQTPPIQLEDHHSTLNQQESLQHDQNSETAQVENQQQKQQQAQEGLSPAAKRRRFTRIEERRQEKYATTRLQGDFPTDDEFVLWVFKKYLWLMEALLPAITSQNTASLSVEEQAAQMSREKEYFKYIYLRQSLYPLFRGLIGHVIPNEVMTGLVKICNALQEGKFLLAEQEYYSVAVGSQAWTVGLARLGIHEREARQRIEKSQIDHIMKDSTIRVYMQAVMSIIEWAKKHPLN